MSRQDSFQAEVSSGVEFTETNGSAEKCVFLTMHAAGRGEVLTMSRSVAEEEKDNRLSQVL